MLGQIIHRAGYSCGLFMAQWLVLTPMSLGAVTLFERRIVVTGPIVEPSLGFMAVPSLAFA